MTAVLFLDIDGVLNCTEFYRKHCAERGRPVPLHALCPDRVARLNRVVEQTGCTVTVSSTWRRDTNCRRHLRRAGFGGRFSRDWRTDWLRTCDAPDASRGDEIDDWLKRNPVSRYAIVDDDSDILDHQRPNFVQTSHETGLTEECAERLVALLRPIEDETRGGR